MKTVLAISGSLRENSLNTKILRAASRLMPEDTTLELYDGVGKLPHFNSDLDCDPLPIEVARLRNLIQGSHGILISSPEYAHGVPGSLKNALDWLVSSTEFPGKPVMMLNVSSTEGEFVEAQLTETLKTMSAKLHPSISLRGPVIRTVLADDGTLSDPKTAEQIRKALALFCA